MKKAIFIIIIGGLIGWVAYDFISSDDTHSADSTRSADNANEQQGTKTVVESDEIGLEKGEIAPDFELQTLDGETVKLSDLRGERVMVNFWATWCPPCRAEMPDMQKLHENTDVKILAVNLIDTESSPEVVPEFLNELGLTFPVLLDEESKLANDYKIAAYPTSFLLDSNGRIQFKALGAINYDIMVREFEKMK